MGLEKLIEKYDSLAKRVTMAIPPDNVFPVLSIKDSASVSLLLEYLEHHESQGIKLCGNETGNPILIFHPGLNRLDGPARWEIAVTAARLMMKAANDLHHLISAGLFTLPARSKPP
jgi:hypothetical protein